MSDLTEKHPTIHLYIYKGKKGISGVATGENGKIINENHRVSLPLDTMEWNNWLKQVIPSGIIKIDVLGIVKEKKDKNGNYLSHTYGEVSEEIKKKVADSLIAKVNINLTPEQKEIAELKAMVEAQGKMIMSQGGNYEESKPEPKSDPELKEARDEYQNVFGKKGGPSWDVATIREKIDAELAKQN